MPEVLHVVKRKLPAAVLVFLLTGMVVGDHSSARAGESRPGISPPLQVIFFFTPGCRMCEKATAVVRQAENKHGSKIQVEWVDLSAPGTANAERLFALLNQYGFTDLTTPPLNVFVGRSHLAGGQAITTQLESVLARELLSEKKTVPAKPEVTNDRRGFWYVTAAALVDGVNPCAFATMVLLVSMLGAAGKSRREIIIVGCAFTSAVYVTYFLIGLLGYGLLRQLADFSLASDLVYLSAFVMAVTCGSLSLYDAVIIWRGAQTGSIILQLPKFLKTRLRRQLSKGVRARNLFVGALSAGAAVSVLEAACTGQVYFPVIAGLLKEDRMRGLVFLAWYNLVFVLPLLAVFGATLLGVSSERLAQLGRRHLGAAKLLLALVFFGMAWWLWPGLIWPPGTR